MASGSSHMPEVPSTFPPTLIQLDPPKHGIYRQLISKRFTPRYLTRMHADYLGDPTATDVITFDLGAGQGPAGELYVSVERAREVAGRRNVAVERELTLYVVHGVLHLCGFDDRDAPDAARMRSAEEAAMAELGFPDDPSPHEFGTRVD